MQTIISQFISILKFNHYFIIDRLRESHNQQKMKQILDDLMEQYKNRLNEQYEILCKVTVEHKNDLITVFQTETNLQTGRLHFYQNQQLENIFNKEDIKSIQLVAFYHKVMKFENIVALASQAKLSPVKKYRNKNFDRIIQVHQNQIKTPQQQSSPQSNIPTIIKKQENEGKKTVRKLMIVSQQQSMQIQPQKSYINLQSDESIREDIIIQSLLLKNNVKYGKTIQQQPQNQAKNRQFDSQKKEKPTASYIAKTVKKPTKKNKFEVDQKSIKKQSLFMLQWLNKIKIDNA